VPLALLGQQQQSESLVCKSSEWQLVLQAGQLGERPELPLVQALQLAELPELPPVQALPPELLQVQLRQEREPRHQIRQK
jgi:hypothetical protein